MRSAQFLLGLNTSALPVIILIALLLYFVIHLINKAGYKKNLPPGPPGLPILGNVHQLASGKPWLAYSKWSKEYGPLIHLNLAGQNAIVIGSTEVAAELLGKRADIYSGRPSSIVLDILTGKLIFAFMQYTSESWKQMRKSAHRALSNNVAKTYHPFQDSESIVLISQLMESPVNFEGHLKRAASSLVLSMIYGQPPITSSADKRVEEVMAFVKRLTRAGSPGAYLVEFFTWMRFLPRWMCKWRREAEEWFRKDSRMVMGLLEDVKKRMNEGTQRPCFMSTVLQNDSSKSTSAELWAWTAMTLYAAGSDTTSGQMTWFIMAMLLHPAAQKKAHEELDRVVGRERLPTFQDYDNLPYVRAILRESMRWRPVAFTGVPHKLDQDDWYNGYFIPKDTLCIPNVWDMNHDQSIYGPDADNFRPERHLNPFTGELIPLGSGLKEEGHVTFGFGKRICVGLHVAKDSMFIQMARILWAFNITPANDDAGSVVLPDPMECIDEGLVVRPKPFRCEFTPRCKETKRIIGYAMDTVLE